MTLSLSLREPWSRNTNESMRHSMSGAQYEPDSVTAIFEPGEALEHARPQEEPHGPRRPPHRLGRVEPEHAGHCAVVVVRGGPGVRVHRQLELLAQRPDRVVAVVRVRRVLAPLRGDDDPAPQARLVRPGDLLDRAVDVGEDRGHDQAGAPLRACRAQLGRPAVVRPGAREHELGIGVGVDREAGAERRAHLAGDRVGAGEHHFTGDAVGRQLLVALGGVPAAAQPDLVQALAVLRPRRTTPPGTRRSPANTSSSVPKCARRISISSASRARQLVVELLAVLRVEDTAGSSASRDRRGSRRR